MLNLINHQKKQINNQNGILLGSEWPKKKKKKNSDDTTVPSTMA